jgi:pyruvate,water dikinase
LDAIGLAQVQDGDASEQRLQLGELAFHLGVLRSRDVPVVDGLVIPSQRFMQHCQQAAILPQLPTVQSLQNFAQQCQLTIQQITCGPWLTPLQQAWDAAEFGYPLVIVRPSFGRQIPIAAHDLLTPQIGAINELPDLIRALWAEIYSVRNLLVWSRYADRLDQIPLATLIQPLSIIEQSGRLWVTAERLIIERVWGVQWWGCPQAVEMDTTVIERATGERQLMRANGQQVVHTILGHWPKRLPALEPLTIAGHHWLLPHTWASTATTDSDRLRRLVSPVTDDAAAMELAQRLWEYFQQPLRVDWQSAHGNLQVQAVYLGEVAPLSQAACGGAVSRQATVLAVNAVCASDASEIATGMVAAPGRIIGRAIVVKAHQALLYHLSAQDILVTSHLTPAWLPLIRNAAGLVTEQSGMTSHAAVMARTLGIPAIVGVPEATQTIRTGDWLQIEAGQIRRITAAQAIATWQAPAVAKPIIPGQVDPLTTEPTTTQLLATISHPAQLEALPHKIHGIGLLRGEHLLAPHLADCSPWQPLSEPDTVRLGQALLEQLQQVLLLQPQVPIWYRFADWRTHELPTTIAVPPEVNPSLGLHGTLRYQHLPDWLNLELQAIAQLTPAQQARLRPVLPFVRTVAEFQVCAEWVAAIGLQHLPLWIMAEVPAVLYALPAFATAGVCGITIGLNDLLQLLFGADREQVMMADFFDPSHPQVKPVLRAVLQQCMVQVKSLKLACTVCSVPADPAFIRFLVECGVTGIAVNPADLALAQQAIVQAEAAAASTRSA